MNSSFARLVGLFSAVLAGGIITVTSPTGAATAATPSSAAPQVRLVVTGIRHSCALLKDGTVRCWGYNGDGQLGYGDTDHRGDGPNEMGDNLPAVDLGSGRKAKAITAGASHTCAILDNNTVKCWGWNDFGQLGYGNNLPVGDDADEMGDNLPAVNLGTGRKVKAITAGENHTCAILDNRTVKCWGLSDFGQLGYGNNLAVGDDADEMGDNLLAVNLGTGRKAKAITSGAHHTCAILDNNSVKCWGYNSFGQLGYGDTDHRGDGPNEMGNNLLAVDLGTGRKAKAITSGASHTCAILDNRTVKCWGYSDFGQLGYGNNLAVGDDADEMGNNLPAVDLGTGRKAKAITAGGYHTCVLLDNYTVKCWGLNAAGRLGYGDPSARGDEPNEMGNNLPAVDLGTGRTAKAITAGGYHTCVLLDNYTVKCWGWNDFGQLGYGDTSTRGDEPNEMGDNLPTVNLGVRVRAIAAGENHTCAILDNRTVKCWGFNEAGQLGYGDTDHRGNGPNEMGDNLLAVNLGTGRTAKAITSGANHTCAILDNNTVKCWGFNEAGQLGYGDTNNRGDGPNEMGDNLLAVNLGTGRTAKAITSGANHTCAILDNNTVKCWGQNAFGQLGYGDTNNRGDDPNETGNNLPAVNLGTGRKAKAITSGDSHTCTLLNNNTVKCWGLNTDGQLGYGDTNNRGDGPNEMGNNLPAANLGTDRKVKAIVSGDYQTCATLDNHTVKCWGYNGYGQLGYGDTNNRGDDPNEMGNNLPAASLGTDRKAKALTGGGNHTCTLLNNNTVKCWGRNLYGQLGQGDTANRGDEPNEMGDNLHQVVLTG